MKPLKHLIVAAIVVTALSIIQYGLWFFSGDPFCLWVAGLTTGLAAMQYGMVWVSHRSTKHINAFFFDLESRLKEMDRNRMYDSTDDNNVSLH